MPTPSSCPDTNILLQPGFRRNGVGAKIFRFFAMREGGYMAMADPRTAAIAARERTTTTGRRSNAAPDPGDWRRNGRPEYRAGARKGHPKDRRPRPQTAGADIKVGGCPDDGRRVHSSQPCSRRKAGPTFCAIKPMPSCCKQKIKFQSLRLLQNARPQYLASGEDISPKASTA